jgi:hypothetical protein
MKPVTRKVIWALSALLIFPAISTLTSLTAGAQTLDCSAAPYNVPAGFPTSATTAVQDQAQMMCQQGLKFPTAASNPPVSATRIGDPHAPVNAWPGNVTNPETANWTDALGHVVVRWGWGLWTTYDDSQSGGVANVLCNGATPCTPALEVGTSTGGSMSGYGDYGPRGSRPYPTGDAPLGPGGNTPCTAPGCLAAGTYTPIDLLTYKKDGSKISTPKDWWTKRRPELWDLVQKEIYGYTWPQSQWPSITWTIGPVATGTQAGTISCITPPGATPATCPQGTVTDGKTYPYREKTYTATISMANYPGSAPPLRNAPKLSMTCRLPANATGKVPVFIGIGESDTIFQYTAPLGYGACGYPQTALQADGGGAATSSYLIGLINGGNWRKPTDPGALVAWAWGISRSIDAFANDTDPNGPDADKVAVEGHSRNGKATLVTAAYDDRVVAALPSCGGEGGTSWIRRHFGESIESIVGNGEYYWMAGNLMNYAGPECQTNPNVGPAGCTPAFFPRKVEDLDVDSHAVMSLVAPRAVMTNGGTDTPQGGGDGWQDPRGMFLTGQMASPVWELLGWPGQIIPQGTVFTSNPTTYHNGESIGGTPPFNVAFTEGTVAWRRHSQGHTDVPEWPVFVQFASKYLSDVRPSITAGQNFTLPASSTTVGTVKGTPGSAGALQNWQIKGGTGADVFDVDPATGAITIPDRTKLNGGSSYTLTLMASDGVLPSHDTVVNINAAAVVAGNIQLATTASLTQLSDGSYQATVTVTNVGTGTAQKVVLTSATFGAASGTPVPQPLIDLAPGGIAVTTLTIPATAGTAGAPIVERFTGTYVQGNTTGTFGANVRSVLP